MTNQDKGGNCMDAPAHLLTRVFEFSASHRLARDDWDDERNRLVYGKCAHPAGHGHNYRLEVSVSGPLDPETGMIIDAGVLKQSVEEAIIADVDHRHLNVDVPWLRGVVPTVEMITERIWERLESIIPRLGKQVVLYRVVLWETPRIFGSKERKL